MSWFTRLFGERSRIARSSQPLPVRLRLEELEPRWVPSGLHQPITSTNWSGYAVSSNAGSVTAVSGAWTVPTLTNSTNVENATSAVWVGIDGYNSNSVEQTGIEADEVNGVAQYSAWYEMYPSSPVTESSLAIHAGDTISASVMYANGKFTLTLTDLSDPAGSNSFTVTQSAPRAQRSSAEWIVEAPSSNGVLPLANFGTATFTSAQAKINGVTGPINDSAWLSELKEINMVSGVGTVEDNTSVLNPAGTGFTVTYGPPDGAGAITSTALVGAVNNPNSRRPTVTLTATVSPSVPVGSEVELLGVSAAGSLSDPTILAIGRVQDVNGVEEVSFTGSLEPGTYTFYAAYLGSGSSYQPSTSATVTLTVP